VSPIFNDPTFWVFVSFVIFFLMSGKPIFKAISSALDKRSDEIRLELEEAVRLREEAQTIVADYRKKEHESLEEAERIVEQTKVDAQQMADRAEADLRDALEKRKTMALQKIAQAETKAVQAVQEHVVDIAISAAKVVVEDQIAQGNADHLIKLASADIEKKIH